MSFPLAEAFTRIFPDLTRMTLPQGTIDIERMIPANDVQLIGTKSKVLVRSDLHPEIVQLLFSNSGSGVKLSAIVLAGPTVLSAVGVSPPHDGVR
jgi:hypothetical protein